MIETGIQFNNIHSYHDLGLVLSAVDIPPAKPKTNYIDIPGGDGSADLTEANGEVKYYDRDAKFTFTMNPAGDLSDMAWEEKKTEISNLLNGIDFKITLDKDDGFYYQGRCTVDSYLSNKRVRQFVISAKLKPYKLKKSETYLKYNVTPTVQTVSITNSRKSVCPYIECSGNNTIVSFGSATYNFSAGVHRTLDITFKYGINKVDISGNGTVAFRFQEGEL